MNLDNYFARFLHKGGSSGTSRSARGEEPVTLSSTDAAPPMDGGAGVGRSSGDAAESQSRQPPHGSPSAAADGGYPPQRWGGGSTASGVAAAAVEEHAAMSLKRPRAAVAEAVTALSSAPSASTPDVPASKRALTRRAAFAEEGEEEDDELALLLGSQKARQVREVDVMMQDVARAQQQQQQQTASPSSDASSACAVGSLAWATLSSTARGAIAHHFQRQFEWELRHDADLFAAFEPFFRDRALHRIAADEELRPVLHAAPPRITSDDVGALPGCSLRSYQMDGVHFLLQHFHCGMSAILGDDMGLGKTAQVSAFLHCLKQLHGIDGPHLIIAPLSTLTGWTRELARWAPTLRVVKYHGERRTRADVSAGRHNRHAVFVTTPALLHLDKHVFRKRAWVTVVVDEAHVLKAHDTAITSASRRLTSCFRVAVTGTPVHNKTAEVWSLMGFLYPWLMAAHDPRAGDHVRQAEACATVLRRIMLRRTKAEMELGIPPRVDEPVTRLEPTYVQLELLSQLTAHALQGDSTGQQLHGHLTHQRVVCNHPMSLRLLADEGRAQASHGQVEQRLRTAGVPMDEAHLIQPSAKMRHLDALLPRLKAEGHRCLIFSNFTSTLDLLEGMCRLRGYSYERLDGACNRVERELAMLRFNHPTSSRFLFLVTTTAGGVGVTLTGADTVILFDAHFNPQLDRQAADRAHRIGQTRTVHVHRLCLLGTMEEHIRDIAARKACLGDFIVEGGNRHAASRDDGGSGGASRITADDIRSMFESLDAKRRGSQPGLASPAPSSTTAQPDGQVIRDDHDDGGRAADDAMVRDLLRVEERGLPGSAAAAAALARRGGGLASPPLQTHHCFCCGAIMRPMEPLLHCGVCPKAYHASCIGERPPRAGEAPRRFWTCPRHSCATCGKQQAADGAIFMCDACPRSFCFDCLDPRYLEMDASGDRLQHIRETYAGMAEEGVETRRSCYYITCLRCCGLASSSSSSSSSSCVSHEDDEEEASDTSDDDSGQ
ncbi:helicase-like protein [Novymonas esmeraldas]|uniref:Helicase-like protein n=1 Tax=Novymonas esmeraldas TaxID=1808958 RepID=A0AAW0EK34_9TRYP